MTLIIDAKYHREWYQRRKASILARQRKYRNTPEYRIKSRLQKRNWNARNPGHASSAAMKWQTLNPQKKAAHRAIAKALKQGLLKKLPCVICGSGRSEAHHEDYTKVLDVIWLCRLHHKHRHLQSVIIPSLIKV